MLALWAAATATPRAPPRASLQPSRGPSKGTPRIWVPGHGAGRPRPPARLAVAAAAAAATPAVAAAASSEPAQPSLLQRIGAFLATNYLPCGLLTSVVLGWCLPAAGTAAAAAGAGPAATIGIFFISGLLLQRGESLAALRSTVAVAYGLTTVLLLTPLLALAIVRLPLQPPEVALGLAIFCCMPTTLSANVMLTTASGGNTAVALLLTIASNTLAVFTIPVMLSLVLGSAAGLTSFNAMELFRNLVTAVLLPLMAGAATQALVPGAQFWKRDHRKLLNYLSGACLCTVPWMQASKASAAGLPLSPGMVVSAAASAVGLHALLLAANLAVTRLVRFNADPAQQLAIRKAVVLASSMKTIPVAVAVITQLSSVLGPGVGFAVLPCVLAHLLQTMLASALVGRWNRREAAGLPPLD